MILRARAFVLGGAIALAALVVGAEGCRMKPEAGAKCSAPGQAVCADKGNALLCKNGAFVTIPCKGPKGCSSVGRGGDIDCDDDYAAEGDNCMSYLNENYACSTDKKKALVCKDDKFQLWGNCRGPNACTITANTVNCDRTVQLPDDPCTLPNNFACSPDKKLMLKCEDGRWAPDNSCRGPKECAHNEEKHRVDCDDTLALEGDPCSDEDGVACSQDAKAKLVCKSHKYVVQRQCKRKDGCAWVHGEAQPRCEW
jgi:hypothetical protein